MATNTTNYGWTKPSYEDAADIEVINGTIDNIDAQVKTVETALGGKVDKETGKVLSTNDYTDSEKTKLDSLAEIKTIGTGLNLDDNGELTATGGGSGGTTNYNDLSNKPQINGNTLSGNKTSAQLGLASTSDIPTTLAELSDDSTHRTVTDTEKVAWNAKADVADIPTVPITAIQKNGIDVTPVSGTVNIIVPTTAADVSALPDTTKYATALSLTINSSTFVMTGQLKDQNGDNLGTAQTIDLPLESVVVGGSYDSQTKKVVLTLQNGNTIEFSVADLVSGLQTELSANNKLNPAYINYDSTHRAVSDTEKSTWNGKQNALSSAQLAAVNSGITSEDVAQIETNKNNISYNINQGVKNLAPNTLASGSTSWGVTAAVNSDGSVVLSGSTPSDHDAVFQLFPNRQFKAGKYSYSGCPSGGEINKWRIDIVINDTMVYRDIGSGIEFTINEDSNIRTQIVIYRGNTAPTADFKPMLKQYGDDTYQPYAMSNAELTAAIQALQEQLANLANQ